MFLNVEVLPSNSISLPDSTSFIPVITLMASSASNIPITPGTKAVDELNCHCTSPLLYAVPLI